MTQLTFKQNYISDNFASTNQGSNEMEFVVATSNDIEDDVSLTNLDSIHVVQSVTDVSDVSELSGKRAY